MKTKNYIQRQKRVRKKIIGTSEKPRLSVFRSNQSVYAQLIDDESGKTIFGVSGKMVEKKGNGKGKMNMAIQVGSLIAEKAKAKKITKVIFDRGRYKYHGIVKALADAVREGGITV